MKKKLLPVVTITALFIVCVVIVTGIEDASVTNQIEDDYFFKTGIEQEHPPKKDGALPLLENISELTGILEYNDDLFYLEDDKLLFGPDEIIKKQASLFDYDNDGIIETIFWEINGLIGSSICVKGYFIEANQFIVLNINDSPIGRPHHPPPRHEHERDPMNSHGLGP